MQKKSFLLLKKYRKCPALDSQSPKLPMSHRSMETIKRSARPAVTTDCKVVYSTGQILPDEFFQPLGQDWKREEFLCRPYGSPLTPPPPAAPPPQPPTSWECDLLEFNPATVPPPPLHSSPLPGTVYIACPCNSLLHQFI